jgi:hypothetical protein
MRRLLITIAAVAFLLLGWAVAFEANATIGAGLAGSARSYSPLHEAACDGQGLFCRKGSALRCQPFCTCEPCTQQMRRQPKR